MFSAGFRPSGFLALADVEPGDTVLINGASGAVGTAAVQLAKHLGAHVTAVCSGGNSGLVKSLGAGYVIDYTAEDFTAGGKTYDVIMDCVGNAPFSRVAASLKPGGALLLVIADLKGMLQAPGNSRRSGKLVTAGDVRLNYTAEDLAALVRLAEEGRYRAVIDRIYPLAEIVQAHRFVDTGRKRGNVVVQVTANPPTTERSETIPSTLLMCSRNRDYRQYPAGGYRTGSRSPAKKQLRTQHRGTHTAWTTRGEGIAQLSPVRVPRPAPGPEEILVRINALSLNFRDLMVINGRDGWKPVDPVVPLSDAAGTVVEAGDGVTRFSIGSRVAPIFLPKWHTGQLTRDTYVNPTGGPRNRGMLAEYVTVHQDEAVEIPPEISDVHAATLPVAATTAGTPWRGEAASNRATPSSSTEPAAWPCLPCSSPSRPAESPSSRPAAKKSS